MNRRALLTIAACGTAGCLRWSTAGDDDRPSNASTADDPRSNGSVPPEPEPPADGEIDRHEPDAEPEGLRLGVDPEAEEIHGVPVERRRYDLAELPYEDRPQFFGPYRRTRPECTYSVSRVERADDLQMTTRDGRDPSHFPLRSARWLLRLLHCYRERGDEGYLDRAVEMSDAFLDAATWVDDVPYFAYEFDKGGSNARLEAPWYSGMVQGVALSAYAYFHELTGDDGYLETADAVFGSFTRFPRHVDGPWTSMVDGEGYYWIEEYPDDPPTHVFNGFNVGLWGVYDYWMHTESPESRFVLEAAITTQHEHAELIRVPGSVSYYGLDGYYYWERGDERYEKAYRGNGYYHAVHIHQLRQLNRISNEPRFETLRRQFDDDHPEERERSG
ncbi:D-glucuronyl C5-epimerase family protein [Haloferacaceae archaeon DSL9]